MTTIDEFPTELPGPQDAVDFGYVGPDPSDLPGGMGGIFAAIPVFMGIFVVVFIGIVVFSIYVWIRNYKASKNAGMNILTLETDLATRAANSQMFAPRQSREQKLAELEGLLARGVITRDEYTQARLKILTD
jgi:hypothetical protein